MNDEISVGKSTKNAYFRDRPIYRMKKDDILTMKAVLLYIIKNSSENRRDVYSIVKTAYYAQQLHFAEWGLPIFNDKISALKFGPVPSTLYNILKLARGNEQERVFLQKSGTDKIADAIGFKDESFSYNEEPDMDYLSKSDIECLDKAIAKVARMSFTQIMNDTHGREWERAFNETKDKVMDNLNIAREGGASEAVVDYLRESSEWERLS